MKPQSVFYADTASGQWLVASDGCSKMPEPDQSSRFRKSSRCTLACLLCSLRCDFMDVIIIRRNSKNFFAQRCSECNHVFGELLFHITITDLHGIVKIFKMIECVFRRNNFHQCKNIFNRFCLWLVLRSWSTV